MKPAMWLSLGVVLLSNALALGGVWYNRSGEPEVRLLLSEREVSLSHDGWLRTQEGGLPRLALNWRSPFWLSDGRLRELVFPDEEHHGVSDRRLARRVWLVLELDGAVYRRQVEQVRESLGYAEADLQSRPDSEVLLQKRDVLRRELEYEVLWASRLMLVDAGEDADALRQRWPDRQRQVLLAARVERSGGGAYAHLENDRLSVPFAYRELVRGWTRSYERSGFRAQVEVAFGRRHEPWVLGIRQ